MEEEARCKNLLLDPASITSSRKNTPHAVEVPRGFIFAIGGLDGGKDSLIIMTYCIVTRCYLTLRGHMSL